MNNYLFLGDLEIRFLTEENLVFSQKAIINEEGSEVDIVKPNNFSLSIINISKEKSLLFNRGKLDEGGYAISLTSNLFGENPGSIYCTASFGWAVTQIKAQDGKIFFEITCPYEFEPGEEIFVHFDKAIFFENTRKIEKMCNISVRYKSAEEKMLYEGNLYGYPKFARLRADMFNCDRSVAGVLDNVKFDWIVSGKVSKVLFIPDYSLNGARDVFQVGNTDFTVFESTNFYLRMENDDDKENIYARCPVTVKEPEIFSFLADKKQIKYGEKTKLNYVFENTYHGYIDNGIGRVEAKVFWENGQPYMKGDISIAQQVEKAVYTISVLGLNGILTSRETVEITNFASISLGFSRVKSGEKYKYSIEWTTKNCTEVFLEIKAFSKIYRNEKGKDEFLNGGEDMPFLTGYIKGEGNQFSQINKKCVQ